MEEKVLAIEARKAGIVCKDTLLILRPPCLTGISACSC